MRKADYDAFVKEFYHRTKGVTFIHSGASLKTRCYFEGERNGGKRMQAWAVRYRHPDSDFGLTRRNWCVDIGINRVEGNFCVCQITLSHDKDKYYLGDVEQDKLPSPTIPKIVQMLAHDKKLSISLDANFTLPVQEKMLCVTKEREWNMLYDWLSSYLRRYVVIVAFGAEVKEAAKYLHTSLVGKAVVVYIDGSPAMKAVMARSDGDDELTTPYNSFRVIFPQVEGDDHDAVNRFYKPEQAKYAVPCVIRNLLSNYILNSGAAVKDIDEVRRMIKMSQLHFAPVQTLIEDGIKEAANENELKESAEQQAEAARAMISNLKTQLSQSQDEKNLLWQMYEEDERKYKHEIQEYVSEVERLKANNSTLDAKNHNLHAQLVNADNGLLEIAKGDYPQDISQVLQIFEKLYKHRLLVAPEAKQSAADFSGKNDARLLPVAWKMLDSVGSILFDMKFGDAHSPFSDTGFQQRAGFELAMTEGRMTKRDAALARSRTLTYNGKDYDFTPHIKYGNRPPKCLRLHFAFMEEEKKILICHLGDHLENRSSLKVK